MTTNFGGVDVVPLLGAIVVCYRCGGRVTTNFGEWTWCHCWVPLQGAIVVCYGGGGGVRWNKWYYLMLTIFPSDTLGSFPPEPCKY